jgi:hypothetical protein
LRQTQKRNERHQAKESDMSTKSDASQGMVRDPVNPKGHAVAKPDGKAIIRGIGRAVNAQDAIETKPRPPQPLKDRQDWHKG